MDLTADTREELEAEAAILHQARQILAARFRTGKHDSTAVMVRVAAVELLSRARHPSRMVPPEEIMNPVGYGTQEPLAPRIPERNP